MNKILKLTLLILTVIISISIYKMFYGPKCFEHKVKPKQVTQQNNKTSNNSNNNKDELDNLSPKIKDIDNYLNSVSFNGNITIYHKGKKVLSKGYGYRDFGNEIKNDPNSMYLIGSANKFVTGMILAQLEEDHKLKITDNVNQYIPHFSDQYPITLRDLMLHQSGLKKYNRNSSFHGLDESIKHIQNNGVDPKFHLKNQYNDVNYIVLSKVIENATNMNFKDIVNKYIKKKISVNNTALYNDEQYKKYFTKGYQYSNGQTIEKTPVDLDQYDGAGNLYMTTDDISKLMFYLQTQKLLNPELTKVLLNPDVTESLPKPYRYGFYVYKTHNRIHGSFYDNDLTQYSNKDYVVTLASNHLNFPYNSEVETHLTHIFTRILKQPYKQN